MKRNEDVLSNIYKQVAEKNGVSTRVVRNIVFSIFKKVAMCIRNTDINDIRTYPTIRIIYFGTFVPFNRKKKNVQTRQE